MKKDSLFSLSLAFVLTLAGLSGSAFAADQAQEAYDAYAQKAAPLEQQLYAKQAELNAVSAALQPVHMRTAVPNKASRKLCDRAICN